MAGNAAYMKRYRARKKEEEAAKKRRLANESIHSTAPTLLASASPYQGSQPNLNYAMAFNHRAAAFPPYQGTQPNQHYGMVFNHRAAAFPAALQPTVALASVTAVAAPASAQTRTPAECQASMGLLELKKHCSKKSPLKLAPGDVTMNPKSVKQKTIIRAR